LKPKFAQVPEQSEFTYSACLLSSCRAPLTRHSRVPVPVRPVLGQYRPETHRHCWRVGFLVWCFPPAVSGWGFVWVGLTPHDDIASTGFHDCRQRTVRQPRPTRPRLATGARPSVPHHHPMRPRRARTTSRPTSAIGHRPHTILFYNLTVGAAAPAAHGGRRGSA